MNKLLISTHAGLARVTMNRPEVHNAFDAELISALDSAVDTLLADDEVHVIELLGAGDSFCAGADLGWMRSMVDYDTETNRRDSLRLAAMYEKLDRCDKPIVSRVQGAAIGGGCGLVAVSDVVVAGPRARFGLSEVRLGLAPAVIAPYVVRKIGTSRARELFLTGDRIGPEVALRDGLVHRVVDDDDALDAAVNRVVTSLLQGGPRALAACKLLAREADLWADPAERTAGIIAGLRVGAEGQEGMRAFLEKRDPSWRTGE